MIASTSHSNSPNFSPLDFSYQFPTQEPKISPPILISLLASASLSGNIPKFPFSHPLISAHNFLSIKNKYLPNFNCILPCILVAGSLFSDLRILLGGHH